MKYYIYVSRCKGNVPNFKNALEFQKYHITIEKCSTFYKTSAQKNVIDRMWANLEATLSG